MIFRRMLAFGLAALLCAGSASAAALFVPATDLPAGTARSADPRVAQQANVMLDSQVLAAVIHATADDQATDRAARAAAKPGEFDLPLFAGKSVHVTRTSVQAAPEGGVVWSGAVSGGGSALLAVANGTVVGFIDVGGKQYLVDPTADGHHAIKQMKPSAYPKDRHIARPKAARTDTATADNGRAVAPVYVDLLAAYTSRAKTTMTSGGATVAQVIDRDVAIVNQGMTASGVPIRLRRVGIAAVTTTYNENANDAVKPLYDVTSANVANFAAIRSMRTSVHADLVAMYIHQSPINYCGVAWVNSPASAAYGFAVVDSYCIGTVTLAHELGHTMGLHHDRYVEPAASASVYNYGYVSTNGNFRDIMSYSDKCQSALRRDCPVVTYYSKPSKLINGVAGGIRQGVAGAADAARWLTEKATTVAAFR